MKGEGKSRDFRHIALDIHKYYSVVAGVNQDGEEILPACRVEYFDLETGCRNISCRRIGW